MKALAINGFGRIGRTFLRTLFADAIALKTLSVKAINVGPGSLENLDLLFAYDSLMGPFQGHVKREGSQLIINEHRIELLTEKDASKLPWKQLGIDWVIECSGHYTSGPTARAHCTAGAGKVLITAPAEDEDITIIPGINDKKFDAQKHSIVSLGSCTTNCFAPLVKVIKEQFGLINGLMTTVHAYTNDQVLLDVEHKDPRRARGAALNIIPTKTGAEKTIIKLYPELEGKLRASCLRVPVPKVSIVDFTATIEKTATVANINSAFKQYASDELKGILAYSALSLVSSDYAQNSASCTIDSLLTQSVGSSIKVFGWYDNEYGYSSRLKDFLLHN